MAGEGKRLRRLEEGELEKYSSAATLSDMEIFVYPELLYPLVLANVLSPAIWRWREDPWFAGMERLSPYRRMLRLKQYVMDHYRFNLDLETWGLTTQGRELARFAGRMDRETIAKSNALFGYEGDKIYFDLDIRRHFGLEKYGGEVLPYWKTETVEAMDGFRRKAGSGGVGAGECVSLSALYAAALHVVCGVDLEDVFLLGTPLHSQNFVLSGGGGVLTNNRRLVTGAMWVNGTELSRKARRALEHEQVTIVAHCSGHVHSVYGEATIDEGAYGRLKAGMGAFLAQRVTAETVACWLRQAGREWQERFYVAEEGRAYGAEAGFAAEEGGAWKMSDGTRGRLLAGVEPLRGGAPSARTDLDAFARHVAGHWAELERGGGREAIASLFPALGLEGARGAAEELVSFCRVKPRWPDGAGGKRFVGGDGVRLRPGAGREETEETVRAAAEAGNEMAELAFYAGRDLARCDGRAWFKAAVERSPVCTEALKGATLEEAARAVEGLEEWSLYEGPRGAQPDEVWNFGCGDGLEKGVLLAAVAKGRDPEAEVSVESDGKRTRVRAGGWEWCGGGKAGVGARWAQ